MRFAVLSVLLLAFVSGFRLDRKLKQFLRRNKLKSVENTFVEHQVDYATLLDMTEDDLRYMGIKALGIQRRILRAVDREAEQTEDMQTAIKTPKRTILAASSPAAKRTCVYESIDAQAARITALENVIGANTSMRLSCADVARGGGQTGFHFISINGRRRKVYCSISQGRAWTLVQSFAFSQQSDFYKARFYNNFPRANYNPTMTHVITSYSLEKDGLFCHADRDRAVLEWLATCNMNTTTGSYARDYAMARFADANLFTYKSDGSCLHMLDINIRGHGCRYCTAPWWQLSYQMHVDSGHTTCQLRASVGAASSEDNFGFASATGSTNTKFSCTSNSKATTNWWFGRLL